MIEPGSGIVAVTGANGYVGCHVVQALLERGHSVRAVVRDPNNEAKVAHVRALAEGRPGALELGRGSLFERGSYDAAFSDAIAVIHTAAVAQLAAADPMKDIIEPSIEGTRNVLASVAASQTVRRFVHTSSVAAVLSRAAPGRVYTEEDWCDGTVKSDPYGYAKREAERLVAAFPDTLPAGRAVSVVRINPSLVVGPVFTKAHAKGSPSVVRDIVQGTFPGMPAFAFGVVDAREVAEAHLKALEDEGLEGRFILSAGHMWMKEMAEALAERFPAYKIKTGKLPGFVLYIAALFDKRMSWGMLKNMLGLPQSTDNTRSREVLGITYRPMADSLADCVESMVAQGFATPKRR